MGITGPSPSLMMRWASSSKFPDPTLLLWQCLRTSRQFDVSRVMVVEDKTLSAKGLEAVANRITVKLSYGKVVTKQVDYHKGHPKNPITDKEVEDKFERLTRTNLTKNRVGRIPGDSLELGESK
ncbi:MmgE/PrpD family protein [Candidatus Bathyarchaeota archaeon]|nr:MAG: MmgE/PrpD family protein [Candidatus Bathyarchaeota archaeon]